MTGDESQVTAEPFMGEMPGTVYGPPDREPAPGVLVLHGSEGRPNESLARALATEGFVTGAVQYFGDGEGIRDDLSHVPLERLDDAMSTLASDHAVAGDEIGIHGTSKGAELALLAGAHLEGVGAVVSVAGSCYAWEGLGQDWRPTGSSSWTFEGDPVSYIPFVDEQPPDDTIRSYYELSLERADSTTIRTATIPVERIDAPIMFISGGADRMWPSSAFAESAVQRLRRNEHEYPVEHLDYEEAGHAIRPPGPGTAELSASDLETLGGSVGANQRASESHWPEVCSFLRAHLGT